MSPLVLLRPHSVTRGPFIPETSTRSALPQPVPPPHPCPVAAGNAPRSRPRCPQRLLRVGPGTPCRPRPALSGRQSGMCPPEGLEQINSARWAHRFCQGAFVTLTARGTRKQTSTCAWPSPASAERPRPPQAPLDTGCHAVTHTDTLTHTLAPHSHTPALTLLYSRTRQLTRSLPHPPTPPGGRA